jgi:hypothetical protein
MASDLKTLVKAADIMRKASMSDREHGSGMETFS